VEPNRVNPCIFKRIYRPKGGRVVAIVLSAAVRMHPIENTKRFVAISSDLLTRGYGVRFRAGGGSMRPAICDGDAITVKPVAVASLTPGRVVVYRRDDRLFAHRIVETGCNRGGDDQVVLRGDAVGVCDAPVTRSQIIGEVVSVSPGRRVLVEHRLVRQIGRGLRRASMMLLAAFT
jgi:signal peptidase I